MATAPKLSFIIDAQTAAAIQQVGAFTRQLQAATNIKPMPNVAGNLTAGVGAATVSLDGLMGKFGAVALKVAGVTAALNGLKNALSEGIKSNSSTEDAALGLATLLAANTTVRDASGAVVEGQEALSVTMDISKGQMVQLAEAGLETSATFGELAESFKTAASAGIGFGFSVDQLRELSLGMGQAMRVMNIPIQQTRSEVNALISGRINRASELAAGLQVTQKDAAQWMKEGPEVYYEKLMEKMAMFRIAGDEAAKTWTGLLAKAEDSISYVLGTLAGPAFNILKKAISDALDKAFKGLDVSDSMAGLAGGVEAAFTGVGTVLADALNGAISLAQDLSGWFDEHESSLLEIGNALGVAWDSFKAIVSSALNFQAVLFNSAGGVNVLIESAKLLARTFAMAVDTLKFGQHVIATLGYQLIDYVLAPLARWLRSFAAGVASLGMSGTADVLRGIADLIPSNSAGLRKLAQGIETDFRTGNTELAKTNALLAKTPALLKAERDAKKNENNTKKPLGSTTPRKRKQDDDDDDAKKAADAAKKAADAYAAALKAYAEAEIEVAKKASDAAREVAGAELEAALADRLITQKEYLDRKAGLEKQALADELTALKARQALLQSEIDKETDPAKAKTLSASMLKTQADIDAIASKEVVIDTKLRVDKEAFQREIEGLKVDITANIMDLEGNPFGSAMQRLGKETQDLLNDPRVREDPALQAAVRRQAELKEQRAQFDEQKRLSDERSAFLSFAEEKIAFQVERGQLTAIQGERAVRSERLQAAEAILKQVEALEALAAANEGNKGMLLDAQKLRLEYEKLAATLDVTATAINRDLAAAGSSFVDSIVKGESVLKSFGNTLADVFGNIAKRFLKQFEDQLFQALQKSNGQGMGGLFSGLLGGGSGGDFLSGLFGMLGFAGGGYTGNGGKHEPAGVVHKGEFVFTKAEVAALGLPAFYGIRNSIRQRRAPGYADGGFVGAGGGLAGLVERSFNPVIQNQNNLAANFTIAPSDIVGGIENTSDFERAVLKVVDRRGRN